MSELKPCPWCSYEPRPLLLATVNASCAVVCNHCGAQGPLQDTEAEAKAAWNRATVIQNTAVDERMAAQNSESVDGYVQGADGVKGMS